MSEKTTRVGGEGGGRGNKQHLKELRSGIFFNEKC